MSLTHKNKMTSILEVEEFVSCEQFFCDIRSKPVTYIEQKYLKDNKISVEVKERHTGMTPIQVATQIGKSDMVKLFLLYKADFRVLDCDGETPMEFALKKQEEYRLVRGNTSPTIVFGRPGVKQYEAIVRLFIEVEIEESTRWSIFCFLFNKNEKWGGFKTEVKYDNETNKKKQKIN
jgi:hypothetical protein